MEKQKDMKDFMPKTIDWHKYNLAKTKEKRLFYELLNELARLIPEPVQEFGRPRIQVKDLFFSAGLKVYSNYSGRKIISDLVHAKGAGLIQNAPHFNTIKDFFNCEATYDLLKRLLTISAMPLKELEDSMSIDSSGFGSYQYERWKKYRFSHDFSESGSRNYLKGHISIGTRTNIICACEVTYGNLSDIKQMPDLLRTTASNFNMKEVSADKAYSSKRMHQLIESLNAIPYIPFKNNANPAEDSPEIWKKMFNLFKKEREHFLKKYHKRSNVETVFSMVKVRLGEFLKSKKYTAQRNELMMKFIAHNICCLIQEIFDNNIKIDFKECADKYIDTNRENQQGLRVDRDFDE